MSSDITELKLRSFFSVNVELCYNKLDFSIQNSYGLLLILLWCFLSFCFCTEKGCIKTAKCLLLCFTKKVCMMAECLFLSELSLFKFLYFWTIFIIFRSHDQSILILKKVSRFRIWHFWVRLNLNVFMQLQDFCFPLPVWIKCKCNWDSFQMLSKEISQPTE